MLEKPEIANTLQPENFQFIEIKPKRNLKSDETYPCKICDKTFVYKKSLVSHQKFHAMKERPFSCEICQKSFKMKGSLKAHQLTHSVEKPITCKKCGERTEHTGPERTHEDPEDVAETFNKWFKEKIEKLIQKIDRSSLENLFQRLQRRKCNKEI